MNRMIYRSEANLLDEPFYMNDDFESHQHRLKITLA